MRFQMPLPVANWHKIRKEQAVKRNEQPPTNRSRKSATQTASFNKPSTSTQSGHTLRNSPHNSNTKTTKNGKANKRLLNSKPKEDIEEIVLDSDSNDSIQYVLDLLKGSTQINDTPISSGHKKSRPYNHMNINVSSSSSKKKKNANVSKNTAKLNNYKQKAAKRKNNASPSANKFQSSHSSAENSAQFKKRKQREYSERRFKRKTKSTNT